MDSDEKAVEMLVTAWLKNFGVKQRASKVLSPLR